jgi:hypothetical protein
VNERPPTNQSSASSFQEGTPFRNSPAASPKACLCASHFHIYRSSLAILTRLSKQLTSDAHVKAGFMWAFWREMGPGAIDRSPRDAMPMNSPVG